MSEQLIDTGGVLTPSRESNIIDEITGSKTPAANAAAPEFSLDSMFGDSTTGDTIPEGNVAPAGGTTQEPITRQPRMKPEEYLRELQSKADKATHQLEQLKQENQELSTAANFVNQLYNDPEVFQAFVADINPELVKPKGPEEYITSNLQKEFGNDFIPDSSEETIRGSRTWLYNKRADALYEEALEKRNKIPDTIESLKTKRLNDQKEFEAKARQEKTDIVDSLKWSQEDYQGFLSWANKVTTKQFAQLYEFGKNKRSSRPSPNLAGVPGGTPISTSAYEQELTEFFGS